MIIGIDPGKSGGLAAVEKGGRFIGGIRTPILKQGNRDIVNTLALDEWLQDVRDRGSPINTYVIEKVGAMPGQGVTSMFNFGRHTGAVEGWALRFGPPVYWVTPQKWKKFFSLSKDKQASLDAARLEFGVNKIWDVKANDGIAEAALMALFFQRKMDF